MTSRSLHPLIRALRYKRVTLSMTQTQLASRIPAHPGTLRHWECGTYIPPVPTLERWAKALGYTLTLTEQKQ